MVHLARHSGEKSSNAKIPETKYPEAPVIIFPEKPLEVSVSPVYRIVLSMYGMLFFRCIGWGEQVN